MRKVASIFIIILACVSLSFNMEAAKTMKKVQQQKQAAQREIKETTQKITQNTKQTNRQLNQLNLINAEILEQGKLIKDLSTQVNVINGKLKLLNDSIAEYDRQLNLMRANYAKAIKKMHLKGTRTNQLLFIFSSDSFTQALRRMRYLREFSKWRERQSEAITALQEKLKERRQTIAELVQTKQKTLTSLNVTQNKLEGKKTDKSVVITQLQKEGSSLQALLKQKESQYNSLDRELNRMIAEEERKAAERARIAEEKRLAEERRKAEEQRIAEQRRLEEEKRQAEAQNKQAQANNQTPAKQKPKKESKPTPTPETKPQENKEVAMNVPPKPVVESKSQQSGYIMDKGERELSGSFESNRGNLLSPVTAAYKVVKPFGRQRHPELRHVETNNGGIDIETSAGASARAVFDGKVSVVFKTDGFNTVVMLRHGNYLTVYVNLEQSYVSAGQTVKAGQSLGKIFSDPDDDNRTILHFEIRKEKEKLNPQLWIK